MNRQELEEKIDESMREYYENQDSNIPEEIFTIPLLHKV